MNSMDGQEALRWFSEAARTLVNGEADKWRENGGKVVGYFCSSMPEEIVTAAGMMPLRIRGTGSKGTDLADAYFSSINCSFPRHCFNQALMGEYDLLDGLVTFNSCDTLRRLYDHWIRQMKTPFVKLLQLPKTAAAPQVDFFREELVDLRRLMEEHFGAEITDADLKEAIRLHNRTRRLLRRLYALRRAEAPPITGAQALAVTVTSTAVPKARFNELLAVLLDELEGTEGRGGHRARLMIIGSELDDPSYVEAIESQGGVVVADSLCFGSRLLWEDVDEAEEDPLKALARYYIAERPSCPRVCTEYEKRNDYVMNMIRNFRVDGVIVERLAFCDLWGLESYSLHKDLKSAQIPFLSLEREYAQTSLGQLRTRVQAFLETIEG